MVIKWRLQSLFSVILSLVTFITSITNNTLQTSLIRAAMGLLLFFIVGVILQFLLNQFTSKGTSQKVVDLMDDGWESEAQNEEISKGDLSFQSIPLNSLHKRED